MSDYRVKITIKNARLLRAIEAAGYRAGPAFAELAGVNYSGVLLPYLNLTRSPLTEDGLLRECAWDLCDFLSASPSDLWSDDQLVPLKKNSAVIEMEGEYVKALASGCRPEKTQMRIASIDQARQLINKEILKLTEREQHVISKRFYDESTRVEIAEELNISVARVMQIEQKALRKLRDNRNIQDTMEDAIINDEDAQ